MIPWVHPARASMTKSAMGGCTGSSLGTTPDPACLLPDRRSAGRVRLLDRPVSVRLEKTDFIIVARSHDMAAGRTGIVAYGLEPTALLFLLVAATRACVTEENI
jgi:hypothetical protein